MKVKARHILRLMAALACAVALLPVCAQADPVVPEIRLQVQLKQPAEAGPCSIVIDAPNGAPLPAQSTLRMTGSAKEEFGPLPLEGPGIYVYTIRMIPGNHPHVKYDTRTYTVRVAVTEDERGLAYEVIAQANGSSDKGQVIFENTLEKPPLSDVPDTGDGTGGWAVLLVTSLAMLGTAEVLRRTSG